MPCLQLSILPKETWQPERGLLGLPRELREQIYKLVLIEPPKWERRHKSTCDHAPYTTTQFEVPPFDTWTGCVCSLRRGCDCALRSVGLLLVDRQIHAETAPIFWTRNVFSFFTASQFTQDMGNLREAYRQMIRHVSILGVHWELHQESWPDMCYDWTLHTGSRAMWETLKQLSGLRTLEMGVEKVYCPEWYEVYGPDWEEQDDGTDEPSRNYLKWLVSNREFWPHLKEFAFARILVYDGNPATSRRDIRYWQMALTEERHLVHVKARQVIDLSKLDTEAKAQEAAVKFRTNHLIHVKHAVETTLFGLSEADFTTSDSLELPFAYELRKGMNETHSRQELKLRDGSVATVQLLGLPVSKHTAIRYAKEQGRDNAQRKAAGKPTRQQEKADKKVNENATKKQTDKDEQDIVKREAELAARLQRLTSLQEEEKQEGRKARRKEQNMVRELQAAEGESKKVERKRTWKPRRNRI